MQAYPLHACKGDSCQQGRAPCKTEALCTATLPPIMTKHGGLDIHRGITPIEYAEPEPLEWYWRVVIAAVLTALIVYAAVSSWAIYLAWPL